MQFLTTFVHSRWYWSALIAVAIMLEGIGLFYQHVLGEPPCVLCIQYRVWVLAGASLALLGLIFNNVVVVRFVAQLALIAVLIKMLLVSRILVLVERGEYEGSCGMDPGFPSWFSLDTWFPNVFEVWTMCGYTPNFLFGLTMGEGLLIGTSVLIVMALIALGFMIRESLKK